MKFIKKTIAIALCCTAVCSLFSSCTVARKTPKVFENRLEYTYENKKLNDGNLSNSVKIAKGESIEIDFGEPKVFDTVALYENGDSCNEFKIYIQQNGEWKMVYQQDRILKYHLCFIGEVASQKLKLEITDSNDDVKLEELSVYLSDKTDVPTKVSQYLVLDAADFEELIDDEGFSGYYDVVTDPIIIGAVHMDENANIIFNNSEEFFAKQLNALKKIIGDRNVRIWCCIGFDQRINDEIDHNNTRDFVNNNIDKISANIKAFVEKYELYGVDFDWEYPENNSQWKAYDLLVVETAKVTNVSVALPPWYINFSESARECIEHINVMAYDLFDERGDHANAYVGGYESISKVRSFGFKDEQILLGIPTYGRTTDKSGNAWPTIRGDGAELGEWGNMIKDYPYVDENGKDTTCDAYLNSYAEARDKTALAIDEGIGGVMIFRAFCDAPYTEEFSLHRAVKEAVDERSK